jgi:hypothetical protein
MTVTKEPGLRKGLSVRRLKELNGGRILFDWNVGGFEIKRCKWILKLVIYFFRDVGIGGAKNSTLLDVRPQSSSICGNCWLLEKLQPPATEVVASLGFTGSDKSTPTGTHLVLRSGE